MENAQRLAVVSIGVALVVLGLKVAAWLMTGSLALGSDALESVVNVATAGIAAFAVRVARMPPDRGHPFGHHKAEYLAAVAEGVLIVLAALLIVREATIALVAPPVLTLSAEGLLTSVAASVLNGAWAAVLLHKGRALQSPALLADGWHLLSDVVSTIAVLAGLGLVAVTGYERLDAVLALAVAVYILWAGARLLGASAGSLMDAAVTRDVATRIDRIIAEHADGALEAHDVRTRVAGRVTFIEFHLVVPGAMSVTDAHAICDALEQALTSHVPGADVVIHLEPHGEARSVGALRPARPAVGP
jgi:cation diffusion facilitator family transporter